MAASTELTQGIPLLRTKLYIPPVRPDLVTRARLVERLRGGLHRKVTLISAPAGFGKTTLVSECVAHCRPGGRVAWVSLGKGENLPSRFWAYVVAALQTVPDLHEAGVGETALAMFESSQGPSTTGLLTGLINEIAALPYTPGPEYRPYMLVLDDLHLIDDAEIHDGLVFFVDNLPPQIHLIVAGRADPPWPLARLRARGDLNELRAPELRFTPDEVASFLNDAMELGLSPEDVAALETRTEGWIAGLQMAAISLRGRRQGEGMSGFVWSFTGSHRFILDYLMEEVLEQQSPAVQEFLLKTSILERVTAPLCDAVLVPDPAGGSRPSPAAQETLEQLEAANLFIVPLDDERKWYRYHHLFSDLLRSRLEQRVGAPGLADLHRRASGWYERERLVEEAVAHAFEAGDVERAADLLERNAVHIIVLGRVSILMRWIEALPREQVQSRPWLCVYQAWSRYWTGQREQVEACLEHAEKALQDVPAGQAGASPVLAGADRQRITGYIAVVRAFAVLPESDVPRLKGLAEQAIRLLPEGDYMRCLAMLPLAEAYNSQGDTQVAEETYARCYAVARQHGYHFLASTIATYRGIQQAKQGCLQDALETYSDAVDKGVSSTGRPLPAVGFPLVKIGDLYREWDDLETAEDYVRRGLEFCAQWGQVDILAESYVALVRLQLAQGDREGARETLHRADEHAGRAKVDLYIVTALDECRQFLWLSEGNLAAAAGWVQASGLEPGDELSYHRDLHHLNLARVLVAQGLGGQSRETAGEPTLAQALRLLDRLLAAAQAADWCGVQIKVLVLQALALRARNEAGPALYALERALALAEPAGYVRSLVDEALALGQALSLGALLKGAAARGTCAGHASVILSALGQGADRDGEPGFLREPGPKPPPVPPSVLPEPLTEREVEVLRLLNTNLTVPEIADQLWVAASTVRSHIKNVYGKLGVHSRMEAVLRAQELGLI